MIVNIYQQVLEKKSLDSQAFFEFLNSLLPEVFLPLIDEFDVLAKNIALFIIKAYSEDSPYIVAGANWLRAKQLIAEECELSDSAFDAVVLLKSETVRDIITEYLKFQNNREFSHLQLKKDLYEILNNDLMVRAMNDEGVVDAKSVRETLQQLDKMLEDIVKLEASIMASEKYKVYSFKEEEVQTISTKQASMNIEQSNFISS